MEKYFGKKSISFIAFLQATGVAIYCALVGALIWKGNEIFGVPRNFVGPALFLVLFIASALITSLMVFAYPFILFWEKKQVRQALSLVSQTMAWLILYIIVTIFLVSFA